MYMHNLKKKSKVIFSKVFLGQPSAVKGGGWRRIQNCGSFRSRFRRKGKVKEHGEDPGGLQSS